MVASGLSMGLALAEARICPKRFGVFRVSGFSIRHFGIRQIWGVGFGVQGRVVFLVGFLKVVPIRSLEVEQYDNKPWCEVAIEVTAHD